MDLTIPLWNANNYTSFASSSPYFQRIREAFDNTIKELWYDKKNKRLIELEIYGTIKNNPKGLEIWNRLFTLSRKLQDSKSKHFQLTKNDTNGEVNNIVEKWEKLDNLEIKNILDEIRMLEEELNTATDSFIIILKETLIDVNKRSSIFREIMISWVKYLDEKYDLKHLNKIIPHYKDLMGWKNDASKIKFYNNIDFSTWIWIIIMKHVIDRYPEIEEFLWRWEIESTATKYQENSGKTIWSYFFPNLSKEQLIEIERTSMGIVWLYHAIEWNDCLYKEVQLKKFPSQLTNNSFTKQQELLANTIKSPDDFNAMLVNLVINDVLKNKDLVDRIKEKYWVEEVDHDVLTWFILKREPELFPSFNSLSKEYKEMIIEWFDIWFNMWQFIFGENSAYALKKLKNIDEKTWNFYLIHFLFDVYWVAWAAVQNWTPIITEEYFQSFSIAIESINKLRSWELDEEEAYMYYQDKRVEYIWVDKEVSFPVKRLSSMLKSDKDETEKLDNVFNKLDIETKNILNQEMTISWLWDKSSILVYYSPAIFSNLKQIVKDENDFNELITIWFKTLAIIYKKVRNKIKDDLWDWEVTVMARQIALDISNNPHKYVDTESLNIKSEWKNFIIQ